MEKNIELIIEEHLTKLLDLMGIKATLEINLDSDVYNVSIKSDNSSLVIGYHGDTLSALEQIINLMVLKEAEKWANIRLDVDGYKELRQSKILMIADRAISKVKFLQKPVALLPMNSFERKIVHEHVSKHPDLESVSEGEKRDRKIIIRPKGQTDNFDLPTDTNYDTPSPEL